MMRVVVLVLLALCSCAESQTVLFPGPGSGIANITNGLTTWLTFDTVDISGSTATDKSGSANNGTLTGSPGSTTGQLGQAVTLNGTTQWVSLAAGSSIQGLSAFTLAFWFFSTASPQTGNAYYESTNSTGAVRLSSGMDSTIHPTCRLRWTDGGSSITLVSSTAVTLSTWHHLVCTFDHNASDALTLYLDGVSVGSDTSAKAAISNTAPADAIGLGSLTGGTPNFYTGNFDDFRLYNRALSASEVTTLFNYR